GFSAGLGYRMVREVKLSVEKMHSLGQSKGLLLECIAGLKLLLISVLRSCVRGLGILFGVALNRSRAFLRWAEVSILRHVLNLPYLKKNHRELCRLSFLPDLLISNHRIRLLSRELRSAETGQTGAKKEEARESHPRAATS